jgi:hypothetical protein
MIKSSSVKLPGKPWVMLEGSYLAIQSRAASLETWRCIEDANLYIMGERFIYHGFERKRLIYHDFLIKDFNNTVTPL